MGNRNYSTGFGQVYDHCVLGPLGERGEDLKHVARRVKGANTVALGTGVGSFESLGLPEGSRQPNIGGDGLKY